MKLLIVGLRETGFRDGTGHRGSEVPGRPYHGRDNTGQPRYRKALDGKL